jgi:hypothetical protein
MTATTEQISRLHYTASQPDEPWEMYYARRISDHFSSPGR